MVGIALHQHDVEKYRQKWIAFGWHAIVVDGHDIPSIVNALLEAENTKGKPTVIIAKTFKGYGLSNVADKIGYHGKPFNEKEAAAAIQELNQRSRTHLCRELFSKHDCVVVVVVNVVNVVVCVCLCV
jgi:transketolase